MLIENVEFWGGKALAHKSLFMAVDNFFHAA